MLSPSCCHFYIIDQILDNCQLQAFWLMLLCQSPNMLLMHCRWAVCFTGPVHGYNTHMLLCPSSYFNPTPATKAQWVSTFPVKIISICAHLFDHLVWGVLDAFFTRIPISVFCLDSGHQLEPSCYDLPCIRAALLINSIANKAVLPKSLRVQRIWPILAPSAGDNSWNVIYWWSEIGQICC